MAIPAQFNDLGKKAKDLLSKKYTTGVELKTSNKSGAATTEVCQTTGKVSDSYVKGTFKDKGWGSLEAEVHSAGASKDTKATLKLDQLYSGVVLKIGANKASDGSLEANYVRDMLATQLTVSHKGGALGLGLCASACYESYILGTSVSLDGAGALKDLNFGAQGTYEGVTAAIKTAKNQSEITASLFGKYSDFTLGGSVVVGTKLATFGVEHALNSSTILKGKVTSAGTVAGALEHKLPGLVMGFSSEFSSAGKADKVGVSMVFGD